MESLLAAHPISIGEYLTGEYLDDGSERKAEMFYLKGVKNFRSGSPVNIILREDTEPFWKECFKVAIKHRVCAVGSPGIGKSTTTPVLIRLLLQKGKTVVFLVRTESRESWYYQFVPERNGNVTTVTTTLFSEGMHPSDIPSLLDPETYYIVDPDMTQDSCNPSAMVTAKVIINASPDSRHWGNNEFGKKRDAPPSGVFRYYPLWSLVEVCKAASYIPLNLDDAQIAALYQKYGGAIRLMTDDADVLAVQESNQNTGLIQLTPEQASNICFSKLETINTMDKSQPKSSVLGYNSKFPYAKGTPVIISDHVRNAIWAKHLQTLWRTMLNAVAQDSMGHFFEDIVAITNIRANDQEAPTRPAVRKAVAEKEEDGETLKSSLVSLPGCNYESLVSDIILCVREGPDRVLFRPTSSTQELIDYIYKVNNVYYAVQVTIGNNPHDAPKEMIERLVDKLELKDDEQLKLLYIVPMDNFQTFRTNPVQPTVEGCEVSIRGFAKPTEEMEKLNLGGRN